MRFTELATRITGVTTPVFGISWQPVESDVAAARRVMDYLEDRRVLYVGNWAEQPRACQGSVQEMRAYLSEQLDRGVGSDELREVLREMRAACRAFLDAVPPGSEPEHGLIEADQIVEIHDFGRGPEKTVTNLFFFMMTFEIALGALRASFGYQIRRLALMYGLDVPGDLARILPPAP